MFNTEIITAPDTSFPDTFFPDTFSYNEAFNENDNNNYTQIEFTLNYIPNNDNNIAPQEILQINPPKILGRKRKNTVEKGKHDKNSEDNMIRKIKGLFRDDLLDFINKKIEEHLNVSEIEIIDNNKGKKELLKIRTDQINDTSVEFNRELLNKTIGEFFSDQISDIYKIYPLNFNELLIKKIYEIDNEGKVTSILNKTFLQCLKYYRKDNNDKKDNDGKDNDAIKDENNKCLNGLEKYFDNLKNKLMKNKDNDEQYVDNLIQLIKNFDKIYNDKIPRQSKKVKNI